MNRGRLASIKRDPDRYAAFKAEWKQRNPEKMVAHTAVHNALRDGKLIRQSCEAIGCVAKAQAHHDDYSKPLEVRWLCPRHHSQLHKEYRRGSTLSGAHC